jgi:hypothetical protein
VISSVLEDVNLNEFDVEDQSSMEQEDDIEEIEDMEEGEET